MDKTALEIRNLHTWNNQQPIIQDLSLHAKQGEAVALVSSCKNTQSSLLDSLLGINPQRKGSILIHQTETIHLSSEQMTWLGVAFCSKSTGLLLDLSCEENLLLPLNGLGLGGGFSLTEIYTLFPLLSHYKDDPCSRLSPGEQHLLALARVLRTGADIIVLHDLHLDICPAILPLAIELLSELKHRGYTLILNESNKNFAANLADKIYLVQNDTVYLSVIHHRTHPISG